MFVGNAKVGIAAHGRSQLLTFFSHHESTILSMPVQLIQVLMFVIDVNVS